MAEDIVHNWKKMGNNAYNSIFVIIAEDAVKCTCMLMLHSTFDSRGIGIYVISWYDERRNFTTIFVVVQSTIVTYCELN